MISEDSIDEIHSSDAYYKNVIFRNNNLVIPYINIGVSNHPLNESDKMKYINFSYIILENINYLDVYINKTYNVVRTGVNNEKLYFGGSYLDSNAAIFNDLELSCTKGYLELLSFSEISDEMFTIFEGSNIPNCLPAELVKDFFNHKFISENTRSLIK